MTEASKQRKVQQGATYQDLSSDRQFEVALQGLSVALSVALLSGATGKGIEYWTKRITREAYETLDALSEAQFKELIQERDKDGILGERTTHNLEP